MDFRGWASGPAANRDRYSRCNGYHEPSASAPPPPPPKGMASLKSPWEEEDGGRHLPSNPPLRRHHTDACLVILTGVRPAETRCTEQSNHYRSQSIIILNPGDTDSTGPPEVPARTSTRWDDAPVLLSEAKQLGNTND